jgi:recombination protein RecA
MPPKKRTAPRAETKSERRKQSDAIAAKLNRDKRFGAGTVVLARDIVVPERATTGALAFDVAMSGGFPVNQWSEVVGQENAGKTTVILKALAALQARDPEYFCVWVASEAFDPDLADKCGVDRSRVYLIEENVMELAFEAVLEFVEGRGCDMVVIDSYPAMVTALEDAKGVDEISMGGAKILNLFMRKCTKASKRSLTDLEDRPFTGIIVNQWREKIGVMHGDPRTTPGGKGKNFWMYARLDVKRDEYITNKQKEKVGQAIKIVCFKMKGARPGQVGVADFYFADHEDFKAGDYDTFKQVINLALLFDVIGRKGSGYEGPEGQFIKSYQLLADTLASDIAWRERVEKEVLERAAHGHAPVEIEDEEADVVPIHLVEDDDPPSAKPRRRRRTI